MWENTHVKKTLVVFGVLASAGAMMAHHGLGNYDTTKAVRVKGTVVEFRPINPHSVIFIRENTADGKVTQWAIEGPDALQIKRRGLAKDTFKPGDVVEVCGYLPLENTRWTVTSHDANETPLSGKLINGETLVFPDGKEQNWGDYGVHKCFAAGYKDQHSKTDIPTR
jgi:hypothetical protein